MKRLQLTYKNLKRLQLIYRRRKKLKNLKNGKNKEDAMYHRCNVYHECSESRCLLELLALCLYHLPDFTLVTCPISSEF